MKRQPLFIVVKLMVAFFCVGWWTGNGALAQVGTCAGDCNHDDHVTVDELVTGVNMALGTLPVEGCPDVDPGGDHKVTVDDLVAAVNNALGGCGAHANGAPRASDVSFSAGTSTPYMEKQLIGSDPDNDTITYELIADAAGTGYQFAYVNPESGVLYVTLAVDFQGTIVLPYHVTDGQLFSNTANVTIATAAIAPATNGGVQAIDPRDYASYPRGFYNGALLGAPGEDPRLPSSVDLSGDFPLPGDQGHQNSCVGWTLGYALKSYQERVEIGWSLDPLEHRFSPAYIYNQLNGGRDNGLIFTDALNLVVDQGVATLDQMPYDDQDLLTQPSDAARQEAFQFRAQSWKEPNGILEIKDALANHLAVMIVIQVFDELRALRGPDSVYNTYSGTNYGAHAVAAVGYDDERYGGALRIMNSWNRNWGDGGYFWLPYAAGNYIVNTELGPFPVLTAAAVLQDAPNPNDPPPDPADPPAPGDSPDLQVTNWYANFDGRPGGSGALQYTVTNTGISTAPAGAYVALVLSRDPTFRSSNILVVYEPIPFELAPGGTAYRDANNTIAFRFPQDLEPGQYYLATWVDMWNDVVESNEDDNVSPATSMVDIVNTLPDMQVVSWYAEWDELGLGSLTYDVVNDGVSAAPAGWQVALALSPNDIIGDGDETVLFSEPANFDVYPGGTLYRDESSAAGFSLYFDAFGNPVPDGDYYIALWLDPYASLVESNESNNASLSWGTIAIGAAGIGSDTRARRSAETSATAPGKAYNGKTLPEPRGFGRRVRLSTISQGRRQTDFVGEDAIDDGGPRGKAAESHQWSKLARARQQVIFPVTEMKAMPRGD